MGGRSGGGGAEACARMTAGRGSRHEPAGHGNDARFMLAQLCRESLRRGARTRPSCRRRGDRALGGREPAIAGGRPAAAGGTRGGRCEPRAPLASASSGAAGHGDIMTTHTAPTPTRAPAMAASRLTLGALPAGGGEITGPVSPTGPGEDRYTTNVDRDRESDQPARSRRLLPGHASDSTHSPNGPIRYLQ